MSTSTDEVVEGILRGVKDLDHVRRPMFLKWLAAHHRCRKSIAEQDLHAWLRSWFDELSLDGARWEGRLIATEIAWWRDLDEETLSKMIQEEGCRK